MRWAAMNGNNSPVIDLADSYLFLEADSMVESTDPSHQETKLNLGEPRDEEAGNPLPSQDLDCSDCSSAEARAWEELWDRVSFASDRNAQYPLPELHQSRISDRELVFVKPGSNTDQVALHTLNMSHILTSETSECWLEASGENKEGKEGGVKRRKKEESEALLTTQQQASPLPSSLASLALLSSLPHTACCQSPLNLPSALRTSDPIRIRRPKKVLIQLDTRTIVTPSSDCRIDSKSISSSEDTFIESAILNPRSPPQRDTMSAFDSSTPGSRRININKAEKHWKLSTSTASESPSPPALQKPGDNSGGGRLCKDNETPKLASQVAPATAVEFNKPLHPARYKTRQRSFLSDSEISFLDLGPSLASKRSKDDMASSGAYTSSFGQDSDVVDTEPEDNDSVAITSDTMSFTHEHILANRRRRMEVVGRGGSNVLQSPQLDFESQDTRIRPLSAPSLSPLGATGLQGRPSYNRANTSFRGMDKDFMLDENSLN
ncbi:hypothetical protein ASPZODRAFT_142037 [Penicilliopsis zonata CBS 506.65]|uniref:Uncharacterized protein n=1 Tax=Penicilliopsis zonata CBS 506.65 TaxID=1073090 RepID=A0A1L9SJR6_9EURO|nr:hypothetical protein ASPZODRAFT_142037 [Penicilliopsis zonata CBS 506.65]OJJ47294.1 hypothetical protein ASPZODRAFT_142037 [Penicilliopsis zonata CBS 506.65]